MGLPKREDCEHEAVCKFDDQVCPMECGHFADKNEQATSSVPFNEVLCPPQLAEVLKTFPLREPDRIVEGPNGEWLAEWHGDGNYFEIECFIPDKLEIMSQFGGVIKHWDLTGA